VRQVELTAKGRALIVRGFREHAAAMEKAMRVLSKKERLTLQRLLKKLGKDAAGTAEERKEAKARHVKVRIS